MSDWVEEVDIGGDRYELKDLQTEALAQQNEQDIEDLKQSVDYSTTEHLTGRKWVDGKDVYELTIANFYGANNDVKTVAALPSRIDTLCSLVASRRSGSGQALNWAPLPYVHDQNKTYDIGLDIDGLNLRLLSRGVDSSQWVCNVTIEYTKAN